MLAFAWAVHRYPAWGGFTRLSIAALALVLVSSLGFLAETLRPFEGVQQRFLYAVLLIWVEAVSLRSYRLAGGQGGRGLPAAGADAAARGRPAPP